MNTCDKCGVEALNRVCNLVIMRDLFFCDHHMRQYADSLRLAGFLVARRPAEFKEPEPV